jgi:DNA-binding CsgD family transcriptional regulator
MPIAVGAMRRRAHNPNSGITQVRPLTTQDLARLREPIAPSNIRRLRESHHEVAYLAAMGFNNVEIAQRLGYTRERIHTLLKAPNVVELVANYRSHRESARIESLKDFESLKSQNMIRAERQIADMLEDSESGDRPLPALILNRLAIDRMDRNGYGKQTTNINVNLDFARKLEAAIARSTPQPKVIDHD